METIDHRIAEAKTEAERRELIRIRSEIYAQQRRDVCKQR